MCKKRVASLLVSLLVFVVIGCYSSNPTLEERLIALRPHDTAMVQASRSEAETTYPPGLALMARQVLGLSLHRQSVPSSWILDAGGDVRYDEGDPLPSELAEAPAMKKLVTGWIDAYRGALQPGEQTTRSSDSEREPAHRHHFSGAIVELNADDVVDLVERLPQALVAFDEMNATLPDAVRLAAPRIVVAYFTAYYKGEFVDRAGDKLEKPKFGTTIGNDTVAGLLAVILEAISEFAWPTPAFFEDSNDKKKYFTRKNVPPTAVSVFADLGIDINYEVKANNPGITRKEAERIFSLSDTAGDLAKSLWGLVVRSLGGVDVGPIVLFGRINVGDNDVLSAAVVTFFEVASRRATAHLSYEALKD